MSRLFYPEPRPAQLATGGNEQPIDIRKLAEKVAKIVPSEVITGYMALINFTPLVRWQTWRPWLYVLSFVLGLGLTPYYLNKMAEAGRPKKRHLWLSTIAFAIWAYFVSGQQVIPAWYDTAFASILLIVYSLLTAAVPLSA